MNLIKISNKVNYYKIGLTTSIILFISLFFFISLLFNDNISNYNILEVRYSSKKVDIDISNPELSGDYDGILNLTNHNDIDTKTFYRGTNITVKGLVYYPLPYTPLNNINVAIVVDGIIYTNFSNKTNPSGYFQIIYNISYSLNIYQSHTIQVKVVDNLNIYYNHQYGFYVNSTSFFNIISPSPGIPGEDYSLLGYLSYDNNTGISSRQINSAWINGSNEISNPPMITSLDGTFPTPLTIPNDNYSNMFYLNLSYSGNTPFINSSQSKIQMNLFRNITCLWNIVSTASEGTQISIRGQILSINNKDLFINYRDVDIYYDGALITTVSTDQNGFFQFDYQVPSGTGNIPIDVEVVNNIGLNIRSNTTHYITVTAAIPSSTSSPSGKESTSAPPFFNFFLVLIPIIIGFVAGFSIYAYFYLKKREKESKTVKVPLEGRIRNLKILKDTGRLEEALSYLFQSIYLELIQAKYNRVKKSTETIRDFAIISVKDLNLNPANIYPFIQNVEKIIYDKPFIINEADFYTSVDLFSPIYFELTGFNFILNF